MDYRRLHSWKVNITQAYNIQRELGKKIIFSSKDFPIKRIAGCDVAFIKNQAKAVVVIFSFPKLDLCEVQSSSLKISFPYVPGLLTFREGPVILKTFRKIKHKPDVVLFDGQGICHPRRLGLATHLGILLNIPTIGCAKTLLWGSYNPVAKSRGSYSAIYDNITREVIGIALRTRTAVKPIFVSVGYKIGLERSRELILALSPKFRIPEPLRYAHRLAKL